MYNLAVAKFLILIARYLVVVPVIFLSIFECQIIKEAYNIQPTNSVEKTSRYLSILRDATTFITTIQNDCTKNEYIRVKSGINGGFSAQFQLIASKFMNALAIGNFRIPVLITGPFNGYSQAPECAAQQNQWYCYFQTTSICHENLLKYGREVSVKEFSISFDDAVPTQFRSLGTAFWWGTIQHYLFRFQPSINTFIQEEMSNPIHFKMSGRFISNGNRSSSSNNAQSTNRKHGDNQGKYHQHHYHGHHRGFLANLPIAGIHVRHGDKQFDGFSIHSLSEELQVLQKSPLCMIQNRVGDCFLPVTFHEKESQKRLAQEVPAISVDALSVYTQALQGNTIILRRKDIDSWNHSYHHSPHLQPVEPHNFLHNPQNNQGSHSISQLHPTVRHTSNENDNNDNSIDSERNAEFVIPLPVFVASDDAQVLHVAQNIYGFLIGSVGTSQAISPRVGMLHTLLKQPSLSFNATKEIIFDIYQLAQCQVLIGASSSQVFRVAVGLANASYINALSLLSYHNSQHGSENSYSNSISNSGHTNRNFWAYIIDQNDLPRVKSMSNKYHIPFPEQF